MRELLNFHRLAIMHPLKFQGCRLGSSWNNWLHLWRIKLENLRESHVAKNCEVTHKVWKYFSLMFSLSGQKGVDYLKQSSFRAVHPLDMREVMAACLSCSYDIRLNLTSYLFLLFIFWYWHSRHCFCWVISQNILINKKPSRLSIHWETTWE